MEEVMKTAAAFVALMMAGAVYAGENTPEHGYFATTSRYQSVNTVKAERAYRTCLLSRHEGITESALAHVAMMKLAIPECEFKELKAGVREVARTAANPELRYKAWLITRVLEHPEIFSGITHGEYNSADELFGALASRLCTLSVKR
jgi:hypothetical protein